jgi:hypothetical protein
MGPCSNPNLSLTNTMMQTQELSPLINHCNKEFCAYSNESLSTLESGDSRAGRTEGADDYDYDIETFAKLETRRKSSTKSWNIISRFKLDRGALQFAVRMAVLLTISSLFVLIRSEKWKYPDGMWVLVSVLFVSWFPSLDAASVIEKITQRLIGTFVGAFLGLSCGFFSIWAFPTQTYQAFFLTACMFIFNFGIIFLSGHCKVGQEKVIKQYAYATILCVLTFCICMLPFGLDKDPKWELGVWRVCNVIVGCLLGALGSIFVWPKSTMAVLHEKTARQVKLAGEASEAVLHMAADYFAGKVDVNRLADELMASPLETRMRWKINRINSGKLSEVSMRSNHADVALKKYEDAIADWKASKMLFPLIKYDPFRLRLGKRPEENECFSSFNKEIARTLARSLRIQTTIVVLDGMVRNDTEYDFGESDLVVFSETGTFIRQMLTLPFQIHLNNSAALCLFRCLDDIRRRITQLSDAVSKPDESAAHARYAGLERFKRSLVSEDDEFLHADDDVGRGIPEFASGSNENSLFFLQLVEHLVHRSLRLYQAWKHVEMQSLQLDDPAIRALLVNSSSETRPGDSLRSLVVA